MTSKKIINIVGPAKNGTTLIGTLLDSHPEISSFPLEMKFITHLAKIPIEKLNSLQFKNEFLKNQKIKYLIEKDNSNKLLNLNIGVFSPPLNFNYNLFSKIFYDQKIENIEDFIIKIHESLDLSMGIKPRDIIVIQDGNHLLKNDLIKFSQKNLKNSKFLFMHRNPMDVYISFKISSRNLKLWRNNIINYKKVYLNDYLTLIKYKQKKLNSFHFVNYENLILNFEIEINKICEFLEIRFNDKLKKPTILGNKWFSNSASQEENDQIYTSSIYNFNKDLNKFEKEYIFFKFEKVFNTLYPEIVIQKQSLSFLKLVKQCLKEFRMNTTKNYRIFLKIIIILKQMIKELK